MSTIQTAVEKLQNLILNSPIANDYKKDLAEVISLLTRKDVLLLEWNSIDIQSVARDKIAAMDDCKVEDIIENPLTQEQVELVIDLLEDQYDCNYGITWETISCQLDSITLPGPELARKRVKVVLEVRSDYLMNIIDPVIKQMIARGREAEALQMIQEITMIGTYNDALEIVSKYVDIEYKENGK